MSRDYSVRRLSDLGKKILDLGDDLPTVAAMVRRLPKGKSPQFVGAGASVIFVALTTKPTSNAGAAEALPAIHRRTSSESRTRAAEPRASTRFES
ncbi:MAG: hypothetical protein AVDCRST_MAG68-478 [uncultured Gemmatimonadetes bacterium]|uniref:Uncharacterized protein n=1 Tax=uncultured Gemmatimonadota bacterium TaxID=203437 RepID=A0A6J4KBI2_9BACT|nr:MAG: hypothetical protein AVDCRST_MAG68-478 [uncultured Gemmatimonadota bacterium]